MTSFINKYNCIAVMLFQIQQAKINLKVMSNEEVKPKANADLDTSLISSDDFNKFKRGNLFSKK